MRILSPKLKRFLKLGGLLVVLIFVIGAGVQQTSAAESIPKPVSIVEPSFESAIESGWDWEEGTPQQSSITDCYTGYPSPGAFTYVNRYHYDAGSQPVIGQPYSLSIVVSGVGFSCAGQYAHIDIGLPPNTVPAISEENPLYCWINLDVGDSNGWQRLYPPECPTTLVESPWYPWHTYPNVYQIESPYGLWDIPFGVGYEFVIPVVSSSTMTGGVYQGSVRISDGDENPVLVPSIGVNVYAGSLPAPGAFNKVSPTHNSTESTSPNLAWAASSDAISYEYCIDTINDNTCNTSWVSTSTSTSTTLSGLATSSTYYWQVRAVNTSGTTYANAGSWWRLYTEADPVPSAPVTVNASNGTFADKVWVGWIGTSGATSYKVYRCTTTSTSSCGSHIGDTSSTTYDDTGATPGILYYYRVTACNSEGCSGYSSYNAGYRGHYAPTGLTASDGAYTDKVRVSWNSSSGAMYYKVYRNTSNTTSTATVLTGNETASPYDDTLATPGTTYYYWVRACYSVGCSEYSSSNSGYRVPPENDPDNVGFYVPGNYRWYLKTNRADGWSGVTSFGWGGVSELIPVVGDWDGDGVQTAAFYKPSQWRWYIKNDFTDGWAGVTNFQWGGSAEMIPIAGDWDGDGDDTVGFYKPSASEWYLKNDNTGGWTGFTKVVWGGASENIPIAGDWDGDGSDTIGFFVPSANRWWLKNDLADGWAGVSGFTFGTADPIDPVTGDWDGDGVDTVGGYTAAKWRWFLKDDQVSGWSNVSNFKFGVTVGYEALAGDWE